MGVYSSRKFLDVSTWHSGPTIVVTGPIGAYSLIFGTPNWIFNTFG